jgi:hypothetical protein
MISAGIRLGKTNEEIRQALSILLVYRVSTRAAARWKAEVQKNLQPSFQLACRDHWAELKTLITAESSADLTRSQLRSKVSKLMGRKVSLRTLYRWRQQILQGKGQK